VKDGDFIRFACSDLAAKWLFGNKAYTQVNNAIDLKNFKFDEKSRNYYKNLLNLQDVTIYGHVGRFVYQKNHDKLIKIFSKIHLKNPKTKLLLVGDGPLIQTVKQQVKELSLDKDVLFLGHRDDVDKLLNMMDYIIFPSRYEGLPISLVEAQANGVPVFYSDSITSEIKLLNTSMAFSITDNSDDIANKILKTNATENRAAATETLRDEGYEKQDVVEQLYNFYQERQ
jgi:glycosyltransferase involved in cell wall biosynthesis